MVFEGVGVRIDFLVWIFHVLSESYLSAEDRTLNGNCQTNRDPMLEIEKVIVRASAARRYKARIKRQAHWGREGTMFEKQTGPVVTAGPGAYDGRGQAKGHLQNWRGEDGMGV